MSDERLNKAQMRQMAEYVANHDEDDRRPPFIIEQIRQAPSKLTRDYYIYALAMEQLCNFLVTKANHSTFVTSSEIVEAIRSDPMIGEFVISRHQDAPQEAAEKWVPIRDWMITQVPAWVDLAQRGVTGHDPQSL